MGYDHRENIERFEAVIVQAYNIIADASAETVADIPATAFEFLGMIEYTKLIEPLVVRDLKAGSTPAYLARRYAVDRSRIRRIRDKYCPVEG